MALTAHKLRETLHYYPDTGHFQWVAPRKGRRVKVGCEQTTWPTYVRRVIRVDGRLYKAHRLAWLWMTGEWPSNEIDHINRDPLDNRWANLRIGNRKIALENRRPYKARKNKSGITGVYWQEKSNRWIVEFKGKYRGCFVDKDEAIATRKRLEATSTNLA